MSAADVFTARELAEKLDAAMGRRDEFHRRLVIAWDALRPLPNGSDAGTSRFSSSLFTKSTRWRPSAPA